MVLRNQLGISNPNAKIILYVGRFRKDKGIEVLISAFAQYISNPDAYLLLVGSDEEDYSDRFQELLGDRLTNFRCNLSTEAPELFMAGSDIFCLPSFREGFGLTLIEASSCGLPVVATRIYGVTDAVVHGTTGLLTQPGDSQEIASALRQLLDSEDTRFSMGASGRARVEKYWSKRSLENELEHFYVEQIRLIK